MSTFIISKALIIYIVSGNMFRTQLCKQLHCTTQYIMLMIV